MGGTQRLPRLVGLSAGIDLIATGTQLSVEQAHGIGLVDRLYDNPAECRDGAIACASNIAQGSAEAVGRAKIAVRNGYGFPLESGSPSSEKPSAGSSPPKTPRRHPGLHREATTHVQGTLSIPP
jgi:enoyl-CoA hydratase/carnithine racemase